MSHLEVMISTVDTTQIGATRPGPDTEVGMCREALKQWRDLLTSCLRMSVCLFDFLFIVYLLSVCLFPACFAFRHNTLRSGTQV